MSLRRGVESGLTIYSMVASVGLRGCPPTKLLFTPSLKNSVKISSSSPHNGQFSRILRKNRASVGPTR